MTLALAVVVTIIPVVPIAIAIATTPVLVWAMSPVMGYVDIVVPLFLNEIDLPVAGVVLATVFAPILRLSGRNAQVERWWRHADRDTLY
jgi:hypothetical protein